MAEFGISILFQYVLAKFKILFYSLENFDKITCWNFAYIGKIQYFFKVFKTDFTIQYFFNTFYTAWEPCVWFMLKIISYQTVWGLCVGLSGFQPGFRGTSGFHEWLTGATPKQTEFAWDEIRNHSSMWL